MRSIITSSSARWPAVVVATVLALGLFPGGPRGASAQQQNAKVNADTFRPSVHPGDILGIQTSNMINRWGWAAGLWATWNHRPLSVFTPGGTALQYVITNQFVGDLQASVNLFGFLDVGIDLPFGMALTGESGLTSGSSGNLGTSLGDLRLGIKGRILGGNGKGFGLAIGEDLSFPTATKAIFLGDDGITSTTVLIADYSNTGWHAALNVGFRAKKAVRMNGTEVGHELLIGAGGIFPIFCGVFEAIATVEARTAATKPFGSKYNDALDLMAGLQLHLGSIHVTAAGGAGALKGYGSPAVRGTVNVSYAPMIDKDCPKDSDGDGIVDPKDTCPNEAGPRGTEGCPDKDNDGVADREDRCPDAAGASKLEGCPDRDNDGVPDDRDTCPDKGGSSKLEGCPDKDNDGVPDHKDTCPDQGGPSNLEGCPDADGDGVPDRLDKCPDKAGVSDQGGCAPLVRLEAKKIEILERVEFEVNKADIREDAMALLNAVAQVMLQHPELKKLQVEGHTDNKSSAKHNLQLSQARANSVREFLLSKGVEPERVTAVGFGMTRPIADNATEEGRFKNRRVEFNIVEREEAAPIYVPADQVPQDDATPADAPKAEPAATP